MTYAGFWRRAMALLVDALVLACLYFIAFWALRGSRGGLLALDVIGALAGAAYAVYLHGRYGQTLGKMASRVQVIMLDGSAMTWRAAWLRSVVDIAMGVASAIGAVAMTMQLTHDGSDVRFIEWLELREGMEPTWLRYTGYAAVGWAVSEILVMLTNSKRRAIHDFIAGTVVVRLETAVSTSAAPGSEVSEPA